MEKRELQHYMFVIDTDSYAGNFERELCAWCTGILGDCGIGDEYADDFILDFPNEQSRFVYKLAKTSDENGVRRPVIILSDEDRKFNSVGILFCEQPSREDIEFIKVRAESFKGSDYQKFKVLGYRVLCVETVTTEIGFE